MMDTTTTHSLTLERQINADPETVFRAWTEPDQLAEWSAPEGMGLPLVEVDLQIGGRYHIRMENAEGQTFNAVGRYLEIERPRRLRYTWRWQESEHDAGETIVTVEFHAHEGGTRVVMVHDLFPTEDARQGHEEGWTSCLNRLEARFAA